MNWLHPQNVVPMAVVAAFPVVGLLVWFYFFQGYLKQGQFTLRAMFWLSLAVAIGLQLGWLFVIWVSTGFDY